MFMSGILIKASGRYLLFGALGLLVLREDRFKALRAVLFLKSAGLVAHVNNSAPQKE